MRKFGADDINIDHLLQNREELEQIVEDYKVTRHLLDHSPLPFAVYNKDDVLTAWNQAYIDLYNTMFDDNGQKIETSTFKYEDQVRGSAPQTLTGDALEEYVDEHVQSQKNGGNDWIERHYPKSGWHRLMRYDLPGGALAGIATNIDELKHREAELEKAKEEAEKTQEYFNDAISELEDGFVIFDANDRLVTYNQAFKNQFGHAATHLIKGETYREMTLSLALSGAIPGVEGREEEFVNGLVEKRNSEEGFSNTFQRHDGKWIRQRDKRTKSGYLIGVRTDITELKEHEIEIKRNSDQLWEITDAMAQGIIVFEHEHVIMFNSKAIEILELNKQILFEGQTLENFFYIQRELGLFDNQEDPDAFVAKQKNLLKTKQHFQAQRVTSGGKLIKVDGVPNDAGRMVVTFTDMSELKKTEQQIQRTSELLQKTTDAMAQGIIVFEEHQVVMFNETAMDLLVLNEDILFKGQTLENFLHMQAEAGGFGDLEIGKKFVENHLSLINDGTPYQTERNTKDGRLLRIDGVPGDNQNLILTFTDITELKEHESLLEETSLRLQETTDAMAQGLIVFEDSKVALFNQKTMELLGIDETILFVGQPLRSFLEMQQKAGYYGDADTSKAFIDNQLEFIAANNPYQVEHVTHEGKYIRADGVPSDDGAMVVTFTDMSELKEREKQIEKTSCLLLETTEAMTQGMLVFDKDAIEFFNDRAKELLAIPEDVLCIGAPWRGYFEYQHKRGDYGAEEVGQAFLDNVIKNVLARKSYEVERDTINGKTLRVNGVPSGTEGWLITFTDITETRARELEVQKTSQLLQDTTDAMIQGMLVFGKKNIEFVNPEAIRMLEVPIDVLCPGKPWQQLIKFQYDRGDYGEGEEAYDKYLFVINSIRNGIPHNIERRAKSGRFLRVDGSPNGAGGWIATYTDISDIKAREETLQNATTVAKSAERAKSEFLANMSHEIRTPMNGVMGMAELLATTTLDPKQKMFTDVIVKSGAALLTIINDILDFSKIDAGQMELDPAPFNLAEAIEDVATLVSSKVAEKDLELIVRIDPALPQIMVGDVGRLRQIVTNLLGNAVKFTERGHVYVNVDGDIHAKDECDFAKLKFSVEDTGIGIPEEQCKQVFQKFSQVDTSATRKHEGTGLGLSIASSLVELMDGRIGVTSEVGTGSTFWFTATMPIHSDQSTDKTVPGDLTGARVLIIDDNEVNRSILTEQAAAWSFDSAAASSGAEGLQVMRAVLSKGINLDLVVLDYQMPEMSGADVLEHIRSDDMLKNVPVLMLTSVDSAQATKRLNSLGVQGNLTKPTRSAMLLETMVQIIATNRALSGVQDQQSIAPPPEKEALEVVDEAIRSEPVNETIDKLRIIQTTASQLTTQSGRGKVEARKPRETPAATSHEQLDILVAEDNEVNQIVVRQILEETGLTYRIVENGMKALDSYKAHQPKMILMDVSMPEMNGKEATSLIREFEAKQNLRHTPIVGVTAHALKGDMELCLEAGMDDYLSKPVSPNKLIAKVDHWLKSESEEAKQA